MTKLTEQEMSQLEHFINLCESNDIFEKLAEKLGGSVASSRTRFLEFFLKYDKEMKERMIFLLENKIESFVEIVDSSLKFRKLLEIKEKEEQRSNDRDRSNKGGILDDEINDKINDISSYFSKEITDDDGLSIITNKRNGLTIIIARTDSRFVRHIKENSE
jgi:hypothetical protein